TEADPQCGGDSLACGGSFPLVIASRDLSNMSVAICIHIAAESGDNRAFGITTGRDVGPVRGLVIEEDAILRIEWWHRTSRKDLCPPEGGHGSGSFHDSCSCGTRNGRCEVPL